MGLDMMLEAKPKSLMIDKIEEYDGELEQLIYWRKANHIHKWFVDNTQDGIDDGRRVIVDAEQLGELVALCEQTIELKDNEAIEFNDETAVLPAQDGFFFGDTSYSRYYFEETERTIVELKKALLRADEVDFIYCASW